MTGEPPAAGAPPGGPDAPDRVTREISRKAARRLRARREGRRGVWFGLGMFGLVGWAVAVPALLGVALGLWLDGGRRGRVSWTLTLLLVGVALGCLNAWYWVVRESRRERDASPPGPGGGR